MVEIGDKEQEIECDTLIDSPVRIPHCWYNGRNGGLDVFEQIVLRHQTEAWCIAYRFTGDAAEAETWPRRPS